MPLILLWDLRPERKAADALEQRPGFRLFAWANECVPKPWVEEALLTMPIMWRESMSVDGGVIDGDHQNLIAIINEFESLPPNAATRNQLGIILMKLHDYTKQHFQREEELQKSINYAECEAHHLQHVRMIDSLSRVQSELSETEADEIFAVHKNMTAFLRSWLIDHIIKSDLYMRPFFCQHKAIITENPQYSDNLHGLSVAVIDDQPFIRYTVVAILRSIDRSFVVSVAGDGETGLSLIDETKPELVLCDIDMQPMDGLRVIEGLRNHANPALRDAAVIVLTSRADGEAIQCATRLSIQGYLVKPVSRMHIEHKLHAIFRGRRPARAAAVARQTVWL